MRYRGPASMGWGRFGRQPFGRPFERPFDRPFDRLSASSGRAQGELRASRQWQWAVAVGSGSRQCQLAVKVGRGLLGVPWCRHLLAHRFTIHGQLPTGCSAHWHGSRGRSPSCPPMRFPWRASVPASRVHLKIIPLIPFQRSPGSLGVALPLSKRRSPMATRTSRPSASYILLK